MDNNMKKLPSHTISVSIDGKSQKIGVAWTNHKGTEEYLTGKIEQDIQLKTNQRIYLNKYPPRIQPQL